MGHTVESRSIGGFDLSKKMLKNEVWSEWWICFTKETREFLRKKMEFGANGGFDFTKELKEMLRKKMGFRANGGFDLIWE